jgi:hypothetical protein
LFAVLVSGVGASLFSLITAAHIVWLTAPVVGWWIGLEVQGRGGRAWKSGLLAAGLTVLSCLFVALLSPWSALRGQTLNQRKPPQRTSNR